MAEAKVFWCQFPTCNGCKYTDTCVREEVVHHRENDPVIDHRTCPECGFVNSRDAMNCERCDYPLQI